MPWGIAALLQPAGKGSSCSLSWNRNILISTGYCATLWEQQVAVSPFVTDFLLYGIHKYLSKAQAPFFFNSLLCLFIWLHWVIVAARGIQFPKQGSNLGPQPWEHRVLAIGPPGKSYKQLLNKTPTNHFNTAETIWGPYSNKPQTSQGIF